MARPRAASSGPAVAMLFSAWHATTQASQPVHVSRSTTIPQRCDIVVLSLQSSVPSRSAGLQACLTVGLKFPQRRAVPNQLAVRFADAGDLHARGGPGE